MSSAKCKPEGSQVQAGGPACGSRWARMWKPVGPHMQARINKKIRMHEITPYILMLSVFRLGLRRYGPAIL